MSKLFDVGKIVNTHGIRGEVKVQRLTDFEERFAIGEKVYIESSTGELIEFEIDGHRMHQKFDLLRFKGFDSLNDIEPFKGKTLKIKEGQLNLLAEGEYYYHDIIGCDVFTTSGNFVGKITHIFETGANDVWEIKSPGGKEILIPFINDVVKEVKVGEQRVTIEPMEGLLE